MPGSEPVRIAYDGVIYSSLRECGITRFYTQLIEHLAALNPEWLLDIHVAEVGKSLRLPQAKNVAVFSRKHLRSRVCSPINYLRLRRAIGRTKPQIIHATLGRSFPFAQCPTVTTVYDLIQHKVSEHYSDRRYNRARQLWERSARCSSAVIAISETTKRDIIEIADSDPAKVLVTYPGVNRLMGPSSQSEIEGYRKRRGLHRPYILYVGARILHKNFPLLAKAFVSSTNLRDFDLVAVGGEEKIAEQELLAPTVRDRVHHLRSIEDEELRLIYGAATVLVFPSMYEGFGFPLVEAMACGTPVVASDIPSTREVCGDACVLFQLGHPADCSAAILRATEPAIREQLVKRGLARVARFTWEECARETKKVYESLL